jgi:orotate phosphoribosyltransferase
MNDIKRLLFEYGVIYTNTDPSHQQSICHNIPLIYRHPDLAFLMYQYIDGFIESKKLAFDAVLSINQTGIPYAADIAISHKKKLFMLNQNNKPLVPIDDDDTILLICDYISTDSDYARFNDVKTALTNYNGIIAGVMVLFDQNMGENVRLVGINSNIPYYGLITFNDLCEYGYSNNRIGFFDYEKFKFNSEKTAKKLVQMLEAELPPSQPMPVATASDEMDTPD